MLPKNNGTNGSSGQVLQVAIGDTACHVAVHGLNLQGLAATTPTLFDANVTHTASSSAVYHPRALLVPSSTATSLPDALQQQQPLQQPQKVLAERSLSNPSGGHTTTAFPFQQAQGLAYGSHSRYRVPLKATNKKTTYQSSGRCVNWDDEEEEEDDEEHNRNEMLTRQERQEWDRTYQSTQDALDQYWGNLLPAKKEEAKEEEEESTDQAKESEDNSPSPADPMESLSWRDFLMPPFSPRMILTPPSANHPSWATTTTYSSNTENEDWVYTVLWEDGVRRQLEECDVCQGLLFHTQTSSSFSTALLRIWQDECPAKSPLVATHMMNHQMANTNSVEYIQKCIQTVLLLEETTDLAGAVLPLLSPGNAKEAAEMAAALELVTLPYRLINGRSNNNASSQVSTSSLSSSSDEDAHVNFRDYLHRLSRQSSRNILNLSTTSTEDDNIFFNRLLDGTHVQRDQRMRQRGQDRQVNGVAGHWLKDTTSLSMTVNDTDGDSVMWNNRSGSLHHHFATSAALRSCPSLRPPVFQKSEGNSTTENLSSCLQQGIRQGYHPEQSIVTTVVDQSLSQLTDGYGAGSYWKHLLPEHCCRPTMAVLDNATTVYPLLHDTVRRAQDIVSPNRKKGSSSAMRSLYQRQVMADMLPEMDDVQEAVAHMLDLRDAYEPPQGSSSTHEDHALDL